MGKIKEKEKEIRRMHKEVNGSSREFFWGHPHTEKVSQVLTTMYELRRYLYLLEELMEKDHNLSELKLKEFSRLSDDIASELKSIVSSES